MSDPAPLEALRHELHVWIARTAQHPLAELAQRYDPLLSADERERCSRFHFDDDRRHYLAAHAVLRLCLAQYLACAPQALRFALGQNGKPELTGPHDAGLGVSDGIAPLRFNLSHTRGMVACVVALERDCGIDVECIRPMRDMDGVANAVFSPSETAWLARREDAARSLAFFTQWTLKEAYIKATGLGMSAPLQRITIDADLLRVRDDSRLEQDDNAWLLDRWLASPEHPLAVACDDASSIRTIVCHEFSLADGSMMELSRREWTEQSHKLALAYRRCRFDASARDPDAR